MKPQPGEKMLDIGGGTGEYVATLIVPGLRVTVGDVDPDQVAIAAQKPGIDAVLLPAIGSLPFGDQEFDIVFCNSVIEHATGPKHEVAATLDDKKFQRMAENHQRALAQEIQRVGKRHFVQTPNKHFLIESHSWLPFPFSILSRRHQLGILRFIGGFWPKRTAGDWHLFTQRRLQNYFPQSRIIVERFLGMPKSFILIGPGSGS